MSIKAFKLTSNNGKNIVIYDDIILYIDNFDSKKFLPIQPLTTGFIDSNTIFVNNEIGCAFSLQCIYQQLNTHPSNVYIYNDKTSCVSNIGYYAYISIKDPKNFKEAALNNTIRKIYMDCELDILREHFNSCKTNQNVEHSCEEDIMVDVPEENLYDTTQPYSSDLREEKKDYSIEFEYDDDCYYKSSKHKQSKSLYIRKKSHATSKKCNYMKSNIKHKIEYKKKSISQTRNMCNSIKRKEFELSKCDSVLLKHIFCDKCSCHLTQNSICYYNEIPLCVNCYNYDYVYNYDFDFGFGYDLDDYDQSDMWQHIWDLNYEIH